jgi:thioredoxin reductase
MPEESATNGSTPTANGSHAGRRSNRAQDYYSQGDRQWLESVVTNAGAVREQFFNRFFAPDPDDIDEKCHYPRTGQLSDPWYFRSLYDREPIATRVCQLMPHECWQTPPVVYESEDPDQETPFEREFDQLNQRLRGEQCFYQDTDGSPIWEYLRRADVLSGIGFFGVMLIGIDDGRNLDQPADGVMTLNPVTNRMWPSKPRRLQWLGKSNSPDDMEARSWQKTIDVVNGERIVENVAYDDFAEPSPLMVPVVNSRGTIDFVSQEDAHSLVANGEMVVNTIQQPDGVCVAVRNQSVLGEYIENGRAAHFARNDRAADKKAGRGFGPNQGFNDPDHTRARTRVSPGSNPERGHAGDPLYPGGGGQAPISSQGGTGGGSTDRTKGNPGSSGRGGFKDAATSAWPTSFAGAQGTDAQYVGVELSPPEYPAAEPSPERRQLLFLRCYDEALVQIVQYEADVRNPRFGMPVMYRITLNDPSTQHSGVGLPLATVRVHWSRVLHLADNLQSSEVFGVPRQRPVLNPILDIRKIRGAGAEGYWKSCFAGIALSTHPQLGGDVSIEEDKTKQMLHEYFWGLNRGLILSGMTAQTLAPQVIDPTPHVAVNLEAICIQLGCPIRVFKGSERGELASSQDDSSWNDRVKGRRIGYVTPRVIVPFIDRMISLGVLSQPGRGGAGVKGGDGSSLQDDAHTSQDADDENGGGGDEKKPPFGRPKSGMRQDDDQDRDEEQIDEDDDAVGAARQKASQARADLEQAPPGAPRPGPPGKLPPGKVLPPRGKSPPPVRGKPPTPGQSTQNLFAPKNVNYGSGRGHGQWSRQEFVRWLHPDGSYGGLRGSVFARRIATNAARARAAGLTFNADDDENKPQDDEIRTGTKIATPTGYSVEWFDIDSETRKDKAQIALTTVQALQAYIQGNVESLVTPSHLFADIFEYSEEQAAQWVADAKSHQSQTMTMPPGGDPGHPAAGEPPPAPPRPTILNPGQSVVGDDGKPGTPAKGEHPPAVSPQHFHFGGGGEGGGGEDGDEGGLGGGGFTPPDKSPGGKALAKATAKAQEQDDGETENFLAIGAVRSASPTRIVDNEDDLGPGRWVTMGHQHVFIREGQSAEQAFKEHLDRIKSGRKAGKSTSEPPLRGPAHGHDHGHEAGHALEHTSHEADTAHELAEIHEELGHGAGAHVLGHGGHDLAHDVLEHGHEAAGEWGLPHGVADASALVIGANMHELVGLASKALGAVAGQKVGNGVADLHDKATKWADNRVESLKKRYGPATAGAILASGGIAGAAGSQFLLGPISKMIPGRKLVGALPFIGLAEAGRRLGVVGHDTKIEHGLARAGSWVHAIRAAVGRPMRATKEALGKAGLKTAYEAGRVAGALKSAYTGAFSNVITGNVQLSKEQIEAEGRKLAREIRREWAGKGKKVAAGLDRAFAAVENKIKGRKVQPDLPAPWKSRGYGPTQETRGGGASTASMGEQIPRQQAGSSEDVDQADVRPFPKQPHGDASSLYVGGRPGSPRTETDDEEPQQNANPEGHNHNPEGHNQYTGRSASGYSSPMTYYGTSREVVDRIRKEGLKATDRVGRTAIFTTTDYQEAVKYAAGQQAGGKIAVVTVPLQGSSEAYGTPAEPFKNWRLFYRDIPPKSILKVDVYDKEAVDSWKAGEMTPKSMAHLLTNAAVAYVPIIIRGRAENHGGGGAAGDLSGGHWEEDGDGYTYVRPGKMTADDIIERAGPTLKQNFNPHHDERGHFSSADEAKEEVDVAEKNKRIAETEYQILKNRWAEANQRALEHVDHPESKEAQADLDDMKNISKEMNSLSASRGRFVEDIGRPGGPKDVVIIGSGPAGMSAAINAGLEGLRATVVERNPGTGGQARYSSRIENYPGFPLGVRGDKLALDRLEQAKRVGSEIRTDVGVRKLEYNSETGMKTVTLSNGEKVQARTVVVSAGLEFRRLKFEGGDSDKVVYANGEKLAYMTKDKPVVVIGGSNGAAQAALKCADTSSHVYLMSRSPISKGMSDYVVSGIRSNRNITVIEGDEIKKFAQEHIETMGGKEIPAHAVGIFVGSTPDMSWLPKGIRTYGGKIKVNPYTMETGIPGVYAAGDVRHGSTPRVLAASADGQVAIASTFKYFEKMKKREFERHKKEGDNG